MKRQFPLAARHATATLPSILCFFLSADRLTPDAVQPSSIAITSLCLLGLGECPSGKDPAKMPLPTFPKIYNIHFVAIIATLGGML